MKIISWNIRGFNSKGELRSLKEKINKLKLDIVLLLEAKMTTDIEASQHCWKFCEVTKIDAIGMAGGIAVL